MIVLNQSIAQARLWLACHPPARTGKVDQSTGRPYTTVVPREWIRAGGAALAACNLVLRASDSRAVVAPGGPALQQRFTLRHSYAPDEDAWTREQPLDTDAPMSLASAWAETRNLAGAIKGLLWDTSSEDVPDPSERPSKPVERGQSQRVIQEEARRNGNGHAKPSRKAVAAAANLAHVTLAGAPIAVELGDEDREKEAREHAEAERLRAQPSIVPPVPDAPGLMDDEPAPHARSLAGLPDDDQLQYPLNQPAKPTPSQAGEAGTAEPARSAVNPSTDAGATALRSEQADGTAPASGPNTDGGAPPSPLASSSTPLTSEASDPSEVGGGSLVGRVDSEGRRLGSALKEIRERIEASGETDEDMDESGNLRDSLRLLRSLPGPTEAERHAKANEKARASRAFVRVSSWPDERREKWLEDSKSADDAAYRKRLVMLARGQTPGECVDIACGEHVTGKEHNDALQALIDAADGRSGERDTDDLSEPTPEQMAEQQRADFIAHQGGMGGPMVYPSGEQVNVVANVATSTVMGPADLRGQRRAERLRSMGERPVLREIVGRKGGKCPACGVEFKKGDEVEVRGGRRYCVVCPTKGATA